MHTSSFPRCCLGYTGQPYLMWEGIQQGIKAKRQGSWGEVSSCQLAITTGDSEGFRLGCSGLKIKYLRSIKVGGDGQQRAEFVNCYAEERCALGVISTKMAAEDMGVNKIIQME